MNLMLLKKKLEVFARSKYLEFRFQWEVNGFRVMCKNYWEESCMEYFEGDVDADDLVDSAIKVSLDLMTAVSGDIVMRMEFDSFMGIGDCLTRFYVMDISSGRYVADSSGVVYHFQTEGEANQLIRLLGAGSYRVDEISKIL